MSTQSKTVVFRANGRWDFGIVRMEVDKVTDKSVWIDGRRVARDSEGTRIADSFEEAKSWLVGVAQRKMEAAEQRVAEAKADMQKASDIRKCDVETKTSCW
jgi:hypothetical protein